MPAKKSDLIKQNRIFSYLAVVTVIILSIPFILMKFNLVKPNPNNTQDQGVNWSLSDFLIMGVLIFGISSLFVAVARLTPKKYISVIGIGFLLAFLWLWAELAVGIFTSWGS